MTLSHRLSSLDGLRAISIFLVLGTHMLPLGPKFLRLNETAGAMGMSVFFALSGFLIVTMLLENDDVIEFLIKRVTRIVPLAYLYALIVFTFIRFDPMSMFWTASFIGNYSGHLNEYNSHFWSLCVEFQFYVVIAVVVAVGGSKSLWVVWPACFCITALRVSQGAYINILSHFRVDEILAGGCLAMICHRRELTLHRFTNSAVAISIVAWCASSSPFGGCLQYIRPYAATALLGSVLCLREGALLRFLASTPMRYFANISYALYIIHHATYPGWMDKGTTFQRYILKRPISFALTFSLAHLSTYYWERPWMARGKRLILRRREALQRHLQKSSIKALS